MVFEKKATCSVVDWVVDQIIQAIINGDLKPGERLPSETELVEQMGVGRNSIREAIKILSAYGILELRRTEGNYIRQGFSPKLLNPLIYGAILNQKSNKDLMDLRRILEKGIQHLAIQNATEEDIQQVRNAMELQTVRSKDPKLTPEEMVDMDISFHERICDCTHSVLLIQLFSVINRVMRSSRLETLTRLLNEGTNDYTILAHQKMYDNLAARDEEHADEAVNFSHLEWNHTLAPKNPE